MTTARPPSAASPLRRAIDLRLLVLYGVGVTVGAGIYALVGEVAAVAGYLSPLSFVLAALVAAPSALSFAELASRMPTSAGEATWVQAGLRVRGLSLLVGLMVVFAGIVSAAAIANAFHGYLQPLLDVPRVPTVIVVFVLLAAVAIWGIAESVTLAGLVTLAEVGGLLLVLVVALPEVRLDDAAVEGVATILTPAGWYGAGVGLILAFYAFLGFEDMVNVAEEVKDVERTLPRGIFLTLAITTLLYAAIAAASVLVVPPATLAGSGEPLALVYQTSGGPWPRTINAIAIVAVLNGALIQLIMASRVLFGLARQGSLPAMLGHVWPRTRTPVAATLVAAGMAMAFALWLPLARLAEIAALTTLCMFALVNLALIGLRRRGEAPAGAWQAPRWAPWAGFACAAGVLVFDAVRRFG